MAWPEGTSQTRVPRVGAAGATFRPVPFGGNDAGCLRGHIAFAEGDRDSVRALRIRSRDIAVRQDQSR
jgi:hypothetical protein